MTYYSSGMNDVLPKPFTKGGLLEIFEVFTFHAHRRRVVAYPRSRNTFCNSKFSSRCRASHAPFVYPLSTTPASSKPSPPMPPTYATLIYARNLAFSPGSFNFGTSDDEGRINPLAGMDLTGKQYNMILQNIVNGEGFMDDMTGIEGLSSGGEKRPLDDSSDGRDSKRSRFEVD